MLSKKERYAELDKRANKLLFALLEAVQQREFSSDFHLSSAAEKPVVAMIAVLAHAATAEEVGYSRRNLSYARTYVAECKAILRAARGVGFLTTSYAPLVEQLNTINTLVMEWMGAITVMRD